VHLILEDFSGGDQAAFHHEHRLLWSGLAVGECSIGPGVPAYADLVYETVLGQTPGPINIEYSPNAQGRVPVSELGPASRGPWVVVLRAEGDGSQPIRASFGISRSQSTGRLEVVRVLNGTHVVPAAGTR
jgi:hypothetical protein